MNVASREELNKWTTFGPFKWLLSSKINALAGILNTIAKHVTFSLGA